MVKKLFLDLVAGEAASIGGEAEIDGPATRSGRPSRKIRELTVPLGAPFLNAKPTNRQVV